jgi:hypothetical protein
MDKFLIALGLLIICSAPACASELLGKISTDPTALISDVVATAPVITNTAGMAPSSKTATIESAPGESAEVAGRKIAEAPAKVEKAVKVLGQKIFADNSLVKDEQGRIWLIQGKLKKPIHDLAELAKYHGRPLRSAKAGDLSPYQAREHLAGDLIRQKNSVKVYALKKEGKRHVLNLAELARDYFGLTIYNLEPEAMKDY